MKARFIGGPKDGHTTEMDDEGLHIGSAFLFKPPRHGPAGFHLDGAPLYELREKRDGELIYIWPALKDRL